MIGIKSENTAEGRKDLRIIKGRIKAGTKETNKIKEDAQRMKKNKNM